MYQVGRAQSPLPEDPKFDQHQITAAITETEVQNHDAPDTVIAVWRLFESGIAPDVMYLVYQGILFWSASGPH